MKKIKALLWGVGTATPAVQRREMNDCTIFRHGKTCNLICLMFPKTRQVPSNSLSSSALCQAGEHALTRQVHLGSLVHRCGHKLLTHKDEGKGGGTSVRGYTPWTSTVLSACDPSCHVTLSTHSMREALGSSVFPTLSSETFVTHEKNPTAIWKQAKHTNSDLVLSWFQVHALTSLLP